MVAVFASYFMYIRFRSTAFWSQSFHWVARLALLVFAFRVLIGVLIGVPMPGKVLFTLPQIQLPDFLVGIRLGGPVTNQRLFSVFEEASLLVALIFLFAAANALSNPHSLLRVLPRRFYGIGLSGVIATSIAPQTVKSIIRVRNAKRLRGQTTTKLRSWRGIAMPVLEDSLERSIDLAASLESRGYGYFPKPSRYRPEKWNSRNTLGISGILYCLATFLLAPNLSYGYFALLLFVLSLTPGIAK